MITWFFIDSFSVVTVGILHTEDILRTHRGGATEARLGTGPLQGFFFLPFMQYSIFSFFQSLIIFFGCWILDLEGEEVEVGAFPAAQFAPEAGSETGARAEAEVQGVSRGAQFYLHLHLWMISESR